MYKIEYLEEAKEDILSLPLEVMAEAREYFEKYKTEPQKYSKKLYNKLGLELEGYRKTYLAEANYRIVIKIEDDALKVVEVVAVGKREAFEVYRLAHKRVNP